MRLIDETFLDDYLADALEEQDSFKGRVDAVLNEGLSGEDGEIPGLDILDTDDAATKPGERSAAPLLTLLAETAGQENITLVVPSEGDVRIPRSRFVADLKAAVDSAAEDARADRQKGNLLDRPLLFARKALRHLNTAGEAYERAKADRNFDKRPLRRVLDELGRAQKAFLGKLGG